MQCLFAHRHKPTSNLKYTINISLFSLWSLADPKPSTTSDTSRPLEHSHVAGIRILNFRTLVEIYVWIHVHSVIDLCYLHLLWQHIKLQIMAAPTSWVTISKTWQVTWWAVRLVEALHLKYVGGFLPVPKQHNQGKSRFWLRYRQKETDTLVTLNWNVADKTLYKNVGVARWTRYLCCHCTLM